MKNLQLRLAVLTAPVLTLAVVLAGCGGDKDKDKGTGTGNGSGDKTGKDSGTTEKTAVEIKSRGTLKGQIVYDGTPPDMAKKDTDILKDMTAKDKKHCVTDAPPEEKTAFNWIVHPQSKGVKNVIVWLSPGKNAFFKLSDEDKNVKKRVEIHQPHCAFIPHCEVAFTHFTTDGKKFEKTGQNIVFKNDAEVPHNTKYDMERGGGDNPLIQPGTEVIPEDIKRPDMIRLSCNIHSWMRGYIRNLDHPFAAVTDENGNYEIKNVPAGVPVHLVIWHEEGGYGAGGAEGKAVTLKDSVNTQDGTIKAKSN